MFYLHIGKLCRFFELPDTFNFPLTQILEMWTLFAKYEGLDKEQQHYVYSVPGSADKLHQAKLYWDKESKVLKKIMFAQMDLIVDKYETCK